MLASTFMILSYDINITSCLHLCHEKVEILSSCTSFLSYYCDNRTLL